MSSGGTTAKGGPKGAQNPPNSASNKKSKSDSKSDRIDLNPKIQATAEQMQIAKIIDTHRIEDPELQKKIRQVMEITRATEDQACMALHSKEYDIEQAITLLTEGGGQSLESEWEQAGKKRKGKTPNQKADNAVSQKDGKGKEDRNSRDKSEKRDLKGEKKDLEGGDQPFIGDQRRGGDRGGRGGIPGRGRGVGRGIGRGGIGRSDKENDEIRGGRMANGPGGAGRGRGGFGPGSRGGRGGGRTFANRARGDREGDTYNTIDVWENSQADTSSSSKEAPMKVEKWGDFPSAEDWDNEEYTGSLADTKVFTPSSQTQGPLSDATNGTTNSNHLQSASAGGTTAADILKMSANQEAGVTMSSVVQGLTASGGLNGGTVQGGQPLDLNMLLKQNSAGSAQHQNPGANLLASLQSYSSTTQMNSGLPQRNKVQRPRVPPSKIPSSAVEMPDEPATSTLDVQFGGMDLTSDSTLSFSSVMQGGKSVDNNMMYGGQGSKLDSFSNDKDMKATGHSPPFQSSINSQSQQGSLSDTGKAGGGNVPPGIESLSLSQGQSKPQPTGPNTFGTAVNSGSNTGSAFVSYGPKGTPNFPAPGFPPVSQNTAGTYNSSNLAPVTGGHYGSQPLPNQQQSAYMTNLPYGTNPQSQPIVASSQNTNVPYGPGSTAPPQNAYHMTSNTSTGYSNSGSTQYGGYGGPKISGLNTSTSSKDSGTDISSTVPVTGSSSSSAQMGSNVQAGSAGTSVATSKVSGQPNTTTNSATKVNSNMPPGIVMPPNMLGQYTPVAPFYGVQAQMYGYEDNSMQFVPRYPPNMGYYDATGSGAYAGVPVAQGVSGRNDAATMQAYSTGGDARFPRSDNSSTASPVPSNLAGGNTQQAMYNHGMPYFYNMVQGSPYAAYPHMFQPQMATQAAPSASGPSHGQAANHQYTGKYNQYTPYDSSQSGPASDFGKGSYGSQSVGPNSSSGKGASGSSTGVSSTTDMSSSMFGKPHSMNKMNSYDKPFGPGQGPYTGAQPNVSQMGGGGMGPPYSVFIPQADGGSNASRQGPGQQKVKQQQYGGGPTNWGAY